MNPKPYLFDTPSQNASFNAARKSSSKYETLSVIMEPSCHPSIFGHSPPSKPWLSMKIIWWLCGFIDVHSLAAMEFAWIWIRLFTISMNSPLGGRLIVIDVSEDESTPCDGKLFDLHTLSLKSLIDLLPNKNWRAQALIVRWAPQWIISQKRHEPRTQKLPGKERSGQLGIISL